MLTNQRKDSGQNSMKKLRHLLRIVTTIFILWVCVTAHAADTDALTIYRDSGIAAQVNSFPATVIASLHYAQAHETAAKVISKDDLREIGALVNKSFDEELSQGVALNYIQKELSPEDLKNVVAWLHSPLGRKIKEIEELNGTDQNMEAMDQFLSEVRANPPAATFLQSISALAKAMHSEEITGDLAISIMKMTLSSVLAASGSLTQSNYQERVAPIQDQKDSFVKGSSGQILEFLLFTYRNLSQEELAKYVEFNRSASGIHYNDVVYKILSSILDQASNRYTQSLYLWGSDR